MEKINDILSKFENGTELYLNNEVFHNCVEHLAMEGDVYKILEKIIVLHSEQHKKYKELIESGVVRQEIVLTKERFDEIIENGKII